MKIVKYIRLGQNKYQIFFDEGKTTLYDEIIIKYNILNKLEISYDELQEYIKENEWYENYYKAVGFLKLRPRSKKELEKYLLKYGIYGEVKDQIIEKVDSQGYLNQEAYAEAYINDVIMLKQDGPVKIKNFLLDSDIDEEIIDRQLELNFTNDIIDKKIKKYINKQVALHKNKSLYYLKNKILTNLIKMGYSNQHIRPRMSYIDFDEEPVLRKEYEKLYNRLSVRFEGAELERRIREKLVQKGFKYDKSMFM